MYLLFGIEQSLPYFGEIVGLFVILVLVAYISHHLRLVPLVGFLLAGVLIGPSVFGLVTNSSVIHSVAEIGVILLLFTIGVEFNLEKLSRIKHLVIFGGTLQVTLTTLFVAGLLALFGINGRDGLFTGAIVALSSTAIVLKLLADRGTVDTLTGQISLGILIFQDLAVVIMVMLLPLLAGQSEFSLTSLMLMLGQSLALIALTLALARRIVPWFLEKVVQTQSQELFLLTVVSICLGTAWLTSLVGISLGLGAFLAGLIISESRYSEHAVSEILPLRTIFSAMFFASIGMLLDIQVVLQYPHLILLAVGAVIVIKIITSSSSVLLLGYPWRIALATGLALAQIGEFSFVLEQMGTSLGLHPAGDPEIGEQIFIATTVLTMIATPFLLALEPQLVHWIGRFSRFAPEETPVEKTVVPEHIQDHVIIVGFGPGGQRLAQVLSDAGIPFVIIDLNPFAISEAEEAGYPAIYGDASRLPILEAANIRLARVLVVNINDPAAARRLVEIARHINPSIYIVVRTKFIEEVEPLLEVGADVVIPEELEITVQIFAHILHAYHVPLEEVQKRQRKLRTSGYAFMRRPSKDKADTLAEISPGPGTRIILIRPDAPIANKPLQELNLQQFGLSILAVYRGDEVIYNPDEHFRLKPGDRILLIGTPEAFAQAAHLFHASKKSPDAHKKSSRHG